MTRKKRMPKKIRTFIARKISKNVKEGKPKSQAIAIAFSQARKKFPKQRAKLRR